MIMQREVQPNTMFKKYQARGLDPAKTYHFVGLPRKYNIKEFGDLVNTAAPIHVKPDSLVHNVLAKFVTMPGEKEEYTARGKKFRLNVASSAGMLPAGPFMTTHYATKAYAASFTRAVERKV